MARRTSLRRQFTNLFSRESRVLRKNRWLDLFPRRFSLSSARTSADVSLLTSLFRRLFAQDRLHTAAVASSSRWAPKFETLEDRRLLAHDGLAPTDVFLSGGQDIDENSANGEVVGSLTVEDSDVGDSHTFTLTNDADGRFEIDINTNNLLVKDGSKLNFEADAGHVVEIQVTDSTDHTFTKTFAIAVNDVNEAPTDITIDSNSVDENSDNGTVVGTLSADDVDVVDSQTFTLLDGAGGRFVIVGNELRVADGSLLDHETDASHDIIVKVVDKDGEEFQRTLTINVDDLTNMTLSANSVVEGSADGTTVGTIAVSDPENPSLVFDLTLTDPAGGRFDLAGDQLLVDDGSLLDFESARTHDITVVAVENGNPSNTITRTFTINVLDANEPPTDILISSSTVDENSANDTVVGELSAVDGDTIEFHTFSIAKDGDDNLLDADGRFKLVGDLLVVKDGSKLDFEAGSLHTVTIDVADREGVMFQKVLTIGVNDINDAPTDIAFTLNTDPDSGDPIPANVNENSGEGTLVVSAAGSPTSLVATDQDAGDTHTFELTDDAGGRFEIVSGNRIQVKKDAVLDFETDADHDITVKATDADGLSVEKTLTIVINDQDFENVAPTDILLSGTTVDENSPGGTVIGVLSAVDGNPEDVLHMFTIEDDPSGFFEVVDILDDAMPPNVIRSELQVRDGAALDFETQASHVITIKAVDAGGLSVEKEITISVNDLVFENLTPSDIDLVDGDGNSINGNVDENSAAGTLIGTLTVSDPNLPNDSHTFSLTDDAGGRFAVVGDQLQVVGNLDFETSVSHVVRVRVEDAGGLSREEDFTITLNDKNDAPTGISVTPDNIDENASNGTLVGVLTVDDADISDSQTFTLLSDADGRFELTDNNEIRVKDGSKLNFEAAASHTIQVRVVDDAGESLVQDVTIAVNDLNESPTGVALTPSAIEGPAADGAVVGVLSAIDEDGEETHVFTGFTDSNPDGAIFEQVDVFDTSDPPKLLRSEIRVIAGQGGRLNFEDAASHTVSVTVTDKAGNTGTFNIVINVIDENEAPFDIVLTGPNSVNEDAANDSVIGNLLVGDDDFGDSHVLTLTDDADGRFKIDGNQLQVADTSKLDFEAKDGDGNSIGLSHQITVLATDAGGLTFEKTFTITVNDVNEDPTDITIDSNSIDENSADGTAVGTLSLVDQDGGSPTFTLDDDAGGRFVLDGSVLRVADSSLLDHEADAGHQVTIIADDGVNDPIERVLTISVNDINETPTDILLNPSSIQEDSLEGTIVGSLTAEDEDVGDSHTFAIDSNAFFVLVGTQVQVKKDAVLDFETAVSHDIVVHVTDSGGETITRTLTIAVNDLNLAPTGIVLGNGSVDENATNGTVIGGLVAVDGDDVPDSHMFAFVVVGEDADAVTLDAGGRFDIIGSQLVVKDGSLLDFETNVTHDITVRVTDSVGHTFDRTFTITVNDLDNEPPMAIVLSSSSVDENSANGTLVAILSAVDADLPDDSHTFAIAKDGDNLLDADGRFELVGDLLFVKDGSKLNFEAVQLDGDGNVVPDGDGNPIPVGLEHVITVTVTDDAGLSLTTPITITVNDVNDAPTDITLGAPGAVNENAAPGTLVGTLGVVDPDVTDAHAFVLVDGAGGRFALVGGDIVVADGSLIDFDNAASHEIIVKVIDSGGKTLTKTLTIAVGDLNEAPTDILLNPAGVAENAPNGTIVGFVTVVDPDALDAHGITLLDNAGGRFGLVGAGTLVVLDSSLLDAETQPSHDIVLRAVDSQGFSVIKTLTVTVTDANDAPTGITLDNMSVPEGVANGTVVGTLTAIDPDADDTHTFIITDDAGGRFAIDGNNLVVADGSLLDFATNPSHDIAITVLDSGGLPAVGLFTIDILEFDNHAPTEANPLSDVIVAHNSDPSVIDVSGVFADEDIPLGDALSVTASSSDDSLVTASLVGDTLTLTYAADASGSTEITLEATDLSGATATSTFLVTVLSDVGPSLQVTDLTPTASGFVVQLNRVIDTSVLNLFVDSPDVTLTGSNGPIAGSLILGDSDDQLKFVATGGVLPGDVYTVTLVSGASAIVDPDGNILDGNGDGVVGDDFTATMVVNAGSDRIVSIPDMARGPGQAVNVPADGVGLPVLLSDGSEVNSVDFTLRYDPAKLDITAVNAGAGLPADWSVISNLSAPAVPGELNVTAFGVSMLSGSDVQIVSLEASVPESASFGSSQALGVSNVVVGTNSGFVDASGDESVHKLAYASDVDGDFFFSAFDAGLIAGVVVGSSTGFAGFELTDPVILANATGTGVLNGLDASWIAQKSVGIDRPEIPNLPDIPSVPAMEDDVASGESEAVSVGPSLATEVVNTTNDNEQTDQSFAALNVDPPATQEVSSQEIVEESYFADLGASTTSTSSSINNEELGVSDLDDSLSDIAGDIGDQWEN